MVQQARWHKIYGLFQRAFENEERFQEQTVSEAISPRTSTRILSPRDNSCETERIGETSDSTNEKLESAILYPKPKISSAIPTKEHYQRFILPLHYPHPSLPPTPNSQHRKHP